MTVRELYELAKKEDALDLDIIIPYRDGGGFYNGFDDDLIMSIEPKYAEYHTEKVVVL